jgi:ATP-dependent helicase/nuclease subunit B
VNLFTIPPHVSFLDAIAAEWLNADPDPLAVSQGLILLPTRRAARALAEAFLRVSDGRPLLLPRIVALGALDEAPLALAGALDLPPAVDPAQRLAVLARLILALDGRHGAPRAADGAWLLAGELARLMDEAERAEIDLAARLPEAADADFAAHWQETLKFLAIVTQAWPAWLAEQGLMNPAARQVALLNAQADAWTRQPPVHRVWAAGATGGIPAVARLLRVIAGLERGAVVLPGLDTAMAEDVWDGLDAAHPQAGLRMLLNGLGARPGDVRQWPAMPASDVPAGRAGMLSRALLPAAALSDWRRKTPAALDGLHRLTPADQQQEAAAIALVLRDALETQGARAALVTPDRDLAGRVAAELARFGIVADDSAGEKLAETPPAVFLRLLARAVAEHLAPVPLLALLKHPLAAAGLPQAACRAAARALEIAILRGPRPQEGLTGLRLGLARAGTAETVDLLERLEASLEPAIRIATAPEEAPAKMLAALVEAAERLAATDEILGPARLWAGEEGEALAAQLASVLAVLPILPDQRRETLPGLLDAVLEGIAVRTRRALRGREGAEHPRVFIWGLLEARLQSAETIVLGGLAESVWPRTTEPGPWMSRQMRAKVGLPSPEEAVGQDAHDFFSGACAAPTMVLSCPRRRDGAPAVPARWLTRLDAFLAGQGAELSEHSAVAWADALDRPADRPRPVAAPRPCPPVGKRPRALSVTEIETWLRDPYAIYARHILKLRPLDPLDQSTDAADYGSLVHAGINRFLREHGTAWPASAVGKLRAALADALGDARLRPALAAWWQPRLDRIADWVAEYEIKRRADAPPLAILSEIKGAWDLPVQHFTLRGRADRIEQRADGTFSIIDYKTGTPPSQKQVDAGLAPQLLLEAAMAEAGAFGSELRGTVAELAYWHLTGGMEAGEVRLLCKGDAGAIATAVAVAAAGLRTLIAAFDDPARCYLSHPHPALAPRFSDYAQLARVAEWAADGEADAP